jgi:hypothetical protein
VSGGLPDPTSWHAIRWEKSDDVDGLYTLVLAKPVVEVRRSGLLGPSGHALGKRELVGWRDHQTVVFAGDAAEYTRHGGRKLKDETVLKRHLAAVEQAWGQPIVPWLDEG